MKTKEKTVSVRIPKISGRDDALYISVGERSWRLKRGCDVIIPECAYDVIRNSELAEEVAAKYIEERN